MSNFKPTSKQVCTYFFSLKDGTNSVFQCKFGITRKKTSTSWTNLMQHVITDHSDYLKIIKGDIDSSTGSLTNYINPQSKTLYGWIKFIVVKGFN